MTSWPSRSREVGGEAAGVPRTPGPKVNAGRSLDLAQRMVIRGQLEALPATG